MISYYKNQFIKHSEISINDNLFRGLGVFDTLKFINNDIIFLEWDIYVLILIPLRISRSFFKTFVSYVKIVI